MTEGRPYKWERHELAELLLRKWFPENTELETGITKDWLLAHGEEYDRFEFNLRVGQGTPPNPDHLPGVQKSTAFSTRKRIDVVAWRGELPAIVEVRERITPEVVGKILTYRQLFLEDHADVPEPVLIAVGRYSDPDTIRVCQAHGITVLLYDSPGTAPPPASAGE